ncbi:hypothetical protein VNO77_27415 [Canavalia gladiata]|uniref:Uncharacterized protein n=1 Tax=Canavalia gladiata TaxID=3824 RepID=A0AAN9QAH3_CANGL
MTRYNKRSRDKFPQIIRRKVPLGPNLMESLETCDAKVYPISNDHGSLMQKIKRKVSSGTNPMEAPATHDAKAYLISTDYGSLM